MRTVPSVLPLAFALFALAASGCGSGGGDPAGARPAGTTVYLRDAAAVPVLDQNNVQVFTMSELFLTITAAEVESSSGQAIALALPASPLRVDILTLSSTATLLAFGSIPPGTYDEIELVLSAAEMTGAPAGSSTPQTVPVALPPSARFEAEFATPVLVSPGAVATFVVDWQPAVRARTGAGPTTYTLEDEVKAFVVGGAAPGSPASQRVDDLEGDLLGVDCAAGVLRIVDGSVVLTVALQPATVYADDQGAALPGGCAGLIVGDEVEVDGVVLPSGAIQADRVEIDRAAGTGGTAGSSGGSVGGSAGAGVDDLEGVVANRSGSGSSLSFAVVQGSRVLAIVETSAATDVERDGGGTATFADIQDGVRVEVEGTIRVAGNATAPPIVAADEVEID